MIPGLGGGLNPKKMNALMKQMGMNQEEIDSEKVIIEKKDGSRILIGNPNVVKITMQGQSSFQISGDIQEDDSGFSEEDIQIVVEKTGKSEEDVKKALEETGDIAEAIVKLSE
jgi:nascent polypeptide-associated complex subunit alpha